MPSVPESGNNAGVDSKSRPPSLKIPEASKYTDVKRTSSASFKPPMSKDPVLKKKTDVPHTDSSWFGPLSYIKSMFGGKPSAESASQLPNNDKVKKVPPMKNTANVAKPKVQDFKETVEEPTPKAEENKMPTILSEPRIPPPPPPTVKDEHSPRFSFTSDQASGRRGRDKSVSKKTEPEEDDPNAPRYNALRFVENKSTYLHTPDKKGTTSFRITTSSKVKSKPNPASLSPVHGSGSSKRSRKSPVSNRKSSASPKKIPQSDSNTTANFPTRLRSKSTPDHSSVKPRPVSDTTCPKSLSLKPNSNKTVPPSLNDANENSAAVAGVKPSSKLSIPSKPTFHGGGKLAQNLLNKKTSSRCSKSSLQIGFTPSPNLLKLTRSSSVGDNRDLNQGTQGSGQNKSDRGNITVSSVKPNSLRPTKPHANVDVKNQENSSITKRLLLDRRSAATKVPPLAESPTFTKPSVVVKKEKTPINRTRGKVSDPLAKFVKAQQRAKDKLKIKESTTEENKVKAHQMVLPATIKHSPCLNSRMGQVTNSKPSSPGSKIVLKRGKVDSAKDISPTIAESPVRRPSPPGVMCLTNNNVSEKNVKSIQDESKKAAVEDQELKPILSLPNSMPDPSRSPIIADVDLSAISPYAAFPTTTSNTPDKQETPDCDTTSSTTNDRYVEPKENIDKHDSTITAFYSDCSEQSVDEDIYHVSSEYHDVSEYHDMSNSACCSDEHSLEYRNNMDVTDYEIDHFSNDCEKAQDTCNSALSRKSFSNRRRCLTSTVSEDFENDLTSGPSIISRKKEGELLPFQHDIGREAVEFFADESPATSATVLKNSKRSPEAFPISSDGSKDKQKGANESRRRFPFDIDTTKIASQEAEQNNTVVGRTPILRGTSPASLRGRSGHRVHPSPYVRTSSPKDLSGGSYLEAINRPAIPTVQEPSLYGETLKRRNRPDSSPNITLSGIASSVGDAIDSIRQKLPSVMKFSESPTKTDSSPMRSEISPTKMLDKPLSATVTYISTFLEDSGLSPLPWNKTGEKKEAEKLSPKTQEVTTKSSKGVTSSLTSSKTADRKKKSSTLEYSDDQKTSAPEVIKTSKKKSQIKDKKNLDVEPKQASPPPSKNVIDSMTKNEISEPAMVDRISKTIEQTKQLLSIVFSPPKKTSSQCKPIEKLEGDTSLLKSETKESKKNKDLAKNETKELKVAKDVSVAVTTGKKDNRELKVTSKAYDSSDPINWPTITKPGFPKVGKSPEILKTDVESPKVLPPTTKTSPMSITAHSLLQKLEAPDTSKQNPTPQKNASATTEGTPKLAENEDKALKNSAKRIGKDTKFLGNGPSNNISHFTESGEMP